MSYLSIATSVADVDLSNRVTACFTQEGGDAGAAPAALFWFVSGAADVEAAYAAALAADNPRPGADEAAVTDAMILAKVQAFNASP